MKETARLFKALSDATRLRILHLLFKSGELCVCDIESTMRATQTKVSRHLAYLKRAGLVEDKRHGLWVLYSVAKPKDKKLKQLLDHVQGILELEDLARRDERQLSRNIAMGCCAIYALRNTGRFVTTPRTKSNNEVSHEE